MERRPTPNWRAVLVLAAWVSGVGVADAAAQATTGDPGRQPIRDRYARGRTELISAINDDRLADGAPPVVVDSIATVVAQAHAEAMAAEVFFSHYDRRGRTPYERMAEAGSTAHVRENIFRRAAGRVGMTERVDPWSDFDMLEVEEWLMASAGHRETILDPHRTGVGIGIAVNEQRNTIVVVQELIASHVSLKVPRQAWRKSTTPVRGRVETRGLRPLAVVLRREPDVHPWSLSLKDPPGGPYRDGEGPGQLVPPWDIAWHPGDRTFELEIPVGMLDEPGRYYGIAYVSTAGSVDGAIGRRAFSTSEGWPGGAFIVDVF